MGELVLRSCSIYSHLVDKDGIWYFYRLIRGLRPKFQKPNFFDKRQTQAVRRKFLKARMKWECQELGYSFHFEFLL